MNEVISKLRPKIPSDISRILDLTRRSGTYPDFSPYFKTAYGSMVLRPIQNEMLWQASLAKGLLGLIGVGEGKTLASFLMPHVLNAKRPLLLIPASMRSQAQADWITYGEHFKLPIHMEMRSYEEISTQPGLLRALKPDLIIADEVHKLKNPNSARTRRVSKHFKWCAKAKETLPMFVGMSGSITSTSIKDFWHLSLWALKESCPLPLKWNYMNAWALTLDKGKTLSRKDLSTIAPIMVKFGEIDPRLGFQKNLLSAQGVVISNKTPPPCSLQISSYILKVDSKTKSHIRQANETWQTPQQEELDSALSLVRLRRQLICGFFYYWDWPNKPDTEWLEARSAWGKACRLYCAKAVEGLDTPALLQQGILKFLRQELDIKFPKELILIYIAWARQKEKPLPPVAVTWFSQYFLQGIIEWAKAQTDPPLIWYEHLALAQALHQITGWPVYGAGKKADEELIGVTAPHIAMISIRSHSQGKNLQVWGNHFVAHTLSDGARWEQLLGRSHRQGQRRATVSVTVPNFSEFSGALASAQQGARYIEEATGLNQRLLRADWVK